MGVYTKGGMRRGKRASRQLTCFCTGQYDVRTGSEYNVRTGLDPGDVASTFCTGQYDVRTGLDPGDFVSGLYGVRTGLDPGDFVSTP
jgi:hypothetical protein